MGPHSQLGPGFERRPLAFHGSGVILEFGIVLSPGVDQMGAVDRDWFGKAHLNGHAFAKRLPAIPGGQRVVVEDTSRCPWETRRPNAPAGVSSEKVVVSMELNLRENPNE